MSFFFCDQDNTALHEKNPSLPLYPGQLNEWVIVFQSGTTDSDVRRSIPLFFTFAGIPLSVAGLSPDVQALTLAAWQLGPPKTFPAGSVTLKGYPFEALPKDSIYATIRFVYTGTERTLVPWPWKSRGFVIQCPEDVIAGVLSVSPPSPAPADLDPDDGLNPFKKPLDTIETALKVVLWGGAAVLLLNLYRATNT